MHFPVEADIEVIIPTSFIEKLPQTIALFTTAQFMHQYQKMTAQLEAVGRKVVSIKTPHTRKSGQMLGCNVQKLADCSDEEFDATLYIGDGFFHPQALLWKNNKPSYMYNPFTQEEYQADEEEVERIKKRYQGALSTFYMAKTVGVLIPHKPGGQLYLQWALELKTLYPDKTFINLLDYNIDFAGLENYPFCEVFVNTACPRIPFEDGGKLPKPVVNLEDVSENFYKKQLAARTVA